MKRLLTSPALRPTVIYGLLAVLWILFSDRIAEALFQDTAPLSTFQTFKGLAFVAATTGLVYFLVRREFQRVEAIRHALQVSETRYRLTFEHAPAGIAHVGLDGRLLRANDQFCNMMGYTGAEITRLTFLDITYPEDLEFSELTFESLAQGPPQAHVFEKRYRRKDGSVLWALVRSVRVPQTDGDPAYLVSIIVDITGEKEVQDKLRQSEERFSKAFRTSPDSVAISRVTDGVYLEVNEGFVALTGFTPREVLGRSSLAIDIWADPADRARMVEILTRDGEVVSFEAPFRMKDGAVRVGLMSARLIEMNGEACILSITRDISARKQMEEDLRLTGRRLEALHDIDRGILAARSPQAIVDVALDRLRQLVQSQRVSVILFPLGGEQPLILAAKYNGETTLPAGRAYEAEHDPNVREWRKGHVVIVEDLRALPERTTTQEMLLAEGIRATATFPMLVQETLVGVLNMGKKQPGPFEAGDMTIAREVADQLAVAIHQSQLYTEVRRYSEELEQRVQARTLELRTANDRLKELDRLKSKFVSDVSHELRTPVTNLGMYLYLLKRAPADKQAEYLAVLEEQADRLKAMVEGILDLSRLELVRQNLRLAPVDLNQIASQAVIAHQPRAEASGLILTFTPHAANPRVLSEPNQLSQVVTNLIANAINYTAAGRISVEVVADGAAAHAGLIVRDTGVGITPEDLGHIFERFYRGEQAVQQAIPGTGLGLGIVKEIVDLHGGRIEVASTPGQGSAFTVWLPVAAAREADRAALAPAEDAATPEPDDPSLGGEAGPAV